MSSTRISGIDVSYYQGNVDWPSVRNAGAVFAIARATYGSTKVDPQFSTYWPAIKNAQLIRGAYHFFLASQDPEEQANLFIKTVGTLSEGDLPPTLDVEADSGTSSSLVSDVQTWLNLVEQKLGMTPIIYTAPSYWNDNLNSSFSKYPLWVAEYGVSTPKSVNGWSNWTFWQHSQSGSINGISGTVDQDYFNGSSNDLQAFAQFSWSVSDSPTPAPTPAPAPTPPPAQPAPSAESQTYTVQSGDTLSAIATRYGTTIDAICQANDIEDPNQIQVGEVLTIP